MPDRDLSPLDRAHALRLSGDRDQALRLSATILGAHADVGAALLTARLLHEAGRSAAAERLAARCGREYLARGDLPRAVIAANAAASRASAEPEAELIETIAEAFGAGSARAGEDASVMPPPLPHEVVVAPFFAQAEGEALFDAAERAAEHFLKSEPTPAGERKLPKLPLFGALSPQVLAKLLSRLQLRELAAGDYAVREGEVGTEAFVLARGVLNVIRGEAGARQLLAVLGPGALFGEMALVSAAPRAASVVAVEPAQLLVASREALEELAGEEPVLATELSAFCHRRMIGNLLRHSALLSAIPRAERAALIARFKPQRFERGDVLVQQGEETSALYLIASGGVQVRSADSEGERVVLAELGAGEVVGEISLVLRRPATAEVVAVHPTVALTLTHDEFREAIREHPALLRELYEMAIQRDNETRSLVAQKPEDAEEIILL